MNLDHPLNCLTFNLQRVSRSLARGFEAAAETAGLSISQFSTLTMLSEMGELTVSQLADHLGTDRTTMTRNLQLMHRKQWITEITAKDHRLRVWKISDAGRDRVAVAMPLWRDYQAKVVEQIGTDDAQFLLGTIAKL